MITRRQSLELADYHYSRSSTVKGYRMSAVTLTMLLTTSAAFQILPKSARAFGRTSFLSSQPQSSTSSTTLTAQARNQDGLKGTTHTPWNQLTSLDYDPYMRNNTPSSTDMESGIELDYDFDGDPMQQTRRETIERLLKADDEAYKLELQEKEREELEEEEEDRVAQGRILGDGSDGIALTEAQQIAADRGITLKPLTRETTGETDATQIPQSLKDAHTPNNAPSKQHLRKLRARDPKSGTQVGSAGGWKLDIYPGDYIVHRRYGIGQFERTLVQDKVIKEGSEEANLILKRRKKIVKAAKKRGYTEKQLLTLMENFGTEKDPDPISRPRISLLEISYSDGMVHVPVDKAYRLSRYQSSDASVAVKLSKIRGDSWRKQKLKVLESTLVLAEDVLALYARRETLHRTPFDPRLEPLIQTFEETFPYTPTPDQNSCFETIENDMVWRRRPMDRLVCGDVGFGKTEVALRALYRCVANGRQAVLLAPTGVLASQHYKHVLARLGPTSPFNVSIAKLVGGMGKNTKVGKAIRAQIATGEAQLIVGTHALLAEGIPYNNLGLLVVDEEQRFGVKQKEKIKIVCNGVDVLTLSATPIPRTLQMSLSGIRDTSTIKSPPPMRKAIQSIVETQTKDIVADALDRELARNGQVFYVVPRVKQIDEATEYLNAIHPGLEIVVAHGQLKGNEAEEAVSYFTEGNGDVLLATTVIENGVDIPNVNTIIIQNANSFGLSTLYQLRGRVGRSNLQAYAYFLHPKTGLTDEATARLSAMAELQELGSGFDVAARDLEIRGAGSLLGSDQSGLAERVGFDLYMRMLKRSIRQLRGMDLPMVPRTKVLLPMREGSLEIRGQNGKVLDGGELINSNTAIEEAEVGEGDYFEISKGYMPNDAERASEEGSARLAESTQILVELTNAWKEKYGPMPSELKNQLKTLHLHVCTRLLGIDLIGLIPSTVSEEANVQDCILRSPGLRPRHWAAFVNAYPKNTQPQNIDAYFPKLFSTKDADMTFWGGKKLDEEGIALAKSIEHVPQPTLSTGKDAVEFYSAMMEEDEDWDAADEEEIEAMKDADPTTPVSAVNVKDLATDIEVDQYPYIRFRDFGSVPEGKRVDALLKGLLPAVNFATERTKEDQERARIAMDMRERREMIKKKRKEDRKNFEKKMYLEHANLPSESDDMFTD